MGTTKKKAAARSGAAASKNTSREPDHSDNATTEQCSRLLDALLQRGSITTLAARRELDVLHPAARIQTLRQAGHKILTVWTTDVTSEGKPHRVALYVLKPVGAA